MEKGKILLAALDKLIEEALDSLDLDNMEECNAFMEPFQYSGNGPAGTRLVERLRLHRPPAIKAGDFFTERGELRIVTEANWQHWWDSGKEKPQLGVWVWCAKVKKDGTAYENGKSHTEVRQLEKRGFLPTKIEEWEYSKEDRAWVKKEQNAG